MDNYIREPLMKAAVETFKYALNIPREDTTGSLMTIAGRDEIIEKRRVFESRLVGKLIALKESFEAAGLGEEYKSFEKKHNNNLFYALTNQEENNTENWNIADCNKFGDMLEIISNLEYELMIIINHNTKTDFIRHTEYMKEVVASYLQGFIFKEPFLSPFNLYLNPVGMERIKELYSFYGVTIPDESRYELYEAAKQEYVDFKSKSLLGYGDEERYNPPGLTTFIIENIKNQLKQKEETNPALQEEEIEEAASKPISDQEESTDDKIRSLRDLLVEYDNLTQKEKELQEKLAEVQARKAAIENVANGIKI